MVIISSKQCSHQFAYGNTTETEHKFWVLTNLSVPNLHAYKQERRHLKHSWVSVYRPVVSKLYWLPTFHFVQLSSRPSPYPKYAHIYNTKYWLKPWLIWYTKKSIWLFLTLILFFYSIICDPFTFRVLMTLPPVSSMHPPRGNT